MIRRTILTCAAIALAISGCKHHNNCATSYRPCATPCAQPTVVAASPVPVAPCPNPGGCANGHVMVPR